MHADLLRDDNSPEHIRNNTTTHALGGRCKCSVIRGTVHEMQAIESAYALVSEHVSHSFFFI